MAITEKDVAAQAKDVARRIGDAEQSRPAGLAIAAWLNDARLDALRTEHIRLAHKYGAEHARVARIRARINALSDAQRELAGELQRSTIKSPRPAEGVAAIHGRVVDANHLGLPALTVRARLAEESTEASKSATDDAGHFALLIRQQKPENEQVSVLLEVLSGNNRVMFRDAEPRQLMFAEVAYTEIEIADRGNPRTPTPPPDSPPKSTVETIPSPRPRAARSRAAKKR